MCYGSHRCGESDSPEGRFPERVEMRVYLAESPSEGSSMGPREKLNGEAVTAAPHGALQPRGGGKRGLQGCLESGEAASGRAQGLGYSSEEAEGRFLRRV